MAVKVAHPYYPRDLKLPNYIPNDRPLVEILGIFFGIVAVALVGTWLYTGAVRYVRNSMADRLKICWFLTCGLIHFILEGWFSVFHRTLAGEQAFLSQMWKEYSKGDSRYVSSDTFTVCMETITAFIDGPLAFLAVYAFIKNKPYRYVVQLVLSLCQLYGDVLYFSTEVMEDFSHSERGHPLYFWFYFVFLNGLWIVIPGALVWQSWVNLSAAQSTVDRQTQKKDK